MAGDDRPHPVALLALGADETVAYLRHHGIDDPQDPGAAAVLEQHLQKIVEDVNRRFSRAERIRNWAIVPGGFPPETFTPTMKLRRDEVAQRLAPEIDKLYRS